MPFATTAALVGAGIAGSVGAAAIGSHGASQAAKTQTNAAMSAAQLQHQDAQQALQFQEKQYADQQKNIAPWLTAGQGAIKTLSGLLSNGGFPDWTGQFVAPTAATEQNDPGFQFRLQQGQAALERSAAARGGLLTGGTAQAEQQFGQDYASNEYSNVYARRFGEYQNAYNQFNQNNTNKFNRYAAISGIGQTSAGQLAQSGQAAAGNVSNILLNSGQQIGQQYTNAGNAQAAAQAATASAYGGALQSGLGSVQDLLLLNQLKSSPVNNPVIQAYGAG